MVYDMIDGRIITIKSNQMNNKPGKMLEADIKAMLIEHLLQKGAVSSGSILINEFTIDNFSRRVDLVTVGEDCLHAYEIKSEADSLYRLESQVEMYLKFFDKVIVVAAKKHIAGVLQKVPEEVTVMEVTDRGLKLSRRGRTRKAQSVCSLLKLMKVSDLKKLSTRLGLVPKSHTRLELERTLLCSNKAHVRSAAIEALKCRYENSSQNFWNDVKGAVYAEQIRRLSPYLADYERHLQSQIDQSAFWETWCEEVLKLPDDPLMANLAQGRQSELFGDVPASVKLLLAA